jgi:hypothetical protein
VDTEEIVGRIPQGRLNLTITDPDGNVKVAGMPIQEPEVVPPLEFETAETVFMLAFEDGSNYAARWQVTDVQDDGDRVNFIGPQGTATLVRRS